MKLEKLIGIAPIALVLVVALVGCAGMSEESLDSAPEVGTAPTGLTGTLGGSTSGDFIDMFMVDLTWDEIDSADGYQLQSNTGDYWYTVEAGEDEIISPYPGRTESVIGYDKTTDYRVRAVFDGGSEVSPWSEIFSITTDPGNALYEVEGTATTASITMRTNTGSEQANIALPLTSTAGTTGIWIQGTNMTPYISAQATSAGTVTCRITVKGTVVSENTSSGRGSIATCSM